MTKVDYQLLKKGGFMRQIQKDRFSLRLRVVGGRLEAYQLAKVCEVAEKYGRGYVHMTSRQGVEIPFIALQDIDAVKAELQKAGLQPGACGPRVRTVTACQGASICPSGLIETETLAKSLDARYFGRELPHKFKIGVTGCRSNCLKTEENDLGIKGGLLPKWQQPSCTYCGLCAAVCPSQSISVADDTFKFDSKTCVYCGKCVKSCPSDAWEGKSGYILSFGGMFGSEPHLGKQLLPILVDKKQVFAAADAALHFFETYGRQGERFAKTLARIGYAQLRTALEEAIHE